MLDRPKTAEISPELEDFITFQLSRLQNALNSQASHILKIHSDLSLTEWRAISLINSKQSTTLAQLSRMGSLDKGQLSRAIKRLIGNGYVGSAGDPDDQRRSILTLSPKGQAIHTLLLPIMRQRQRALTSELSEEELDVFRKSVRKIKTAAQNRDF